jgi:Ca-activated chloride channel family protein
MGSDHMKTSAEATTGSAMFAVFPTFDRRQIQHFGTVMPAILLAFLLAACSGDPQPVEATLATLEPVRGQVQIDDQTAAPTSRVGPGQQLALGDDALARLTLDHGPRLLIDRTARLAIDETGAVTLSAGRIFAQIPQGDRLRISTTGGALAAGDAELALEAQQGASTLYVVRGEVSWTAGDNRGVVRAGQQIRIGAEQQPSPAQLWDDWTGGLARPGPGQGIESEGVGTLEGRVPDEVGMARWPLAMRRLEVRVVIDGDMALTEVDQEFFNPASETVEGLYRMRVPEGAVLQRFAVDRDGHLADGFVRERAQARASYEAQVYRGSTDDPALLEWEGPGAYQARIYPIGAGETRRIVVRYAQWLRRSAGDGPRLYRYPMGGGSRPPHIGELALEVNLARAEAGRVRAGMGAVVEGDRVLLRRSDLEPRADFWLELFDDQARASRTKARAYQGEHRPPKRAPGARAIPNEADERDYWFLPLELPLGLGGERVERERLDLVIVADISAGTDRSRMELGRSVAESLAAHLDEGDRVAVVTSDLTIRSVGEAAPALVEASDANMEALLDGLARVPSGGASDLGAALAAAGELLEGEGRGAVVYVGDGAPTVGELGAAGLLQSLDRLPRALRLYAVGVGSEANLDLLEAVTRGGGLALRVEDRSEAAEAALRVLAHAGRPIAQSVEVELGSGIDNVFPRGRVDVVLGDVLNLVGRVRDDVPTTVRVRGRINGQPFEHEVGIETVELADPVDLRLRWAGERLRQLLLAGEGREAVAELGTRCGLITPFTSYYVPSARELRESGELSRLLDQPLLLGPSRRVPTVGERALSKVAVAMAGPLALTGCWSLGGESESPVDERVVQNQTPAGGQPAPTMPAPPPAEPTLETPVTLTTSPPVAEVSLDGQDSSGVRHRGEEGHMGQAKAASDNRYGILGPDDQAQPNLARDQAREPAPSSGSQIALDPSAAAEPDQPFNAEMERRARVTEDVGRNAPAKLIGSRGAGDDSTVADALRGGDVETDVDEVMAQVRGVGLSRSGENSRFQDEDGEQDNSEIMNGLGQLGYTGDGYGGGGRGRRRDRGPSVKTGFRSSSASGNDPADVLRLLMTSTTTTTVTSVSLWAQTSHRPRRCSDAMGLSLADRRALWEERLGNESTPAGWVRIYREAIRKCEAPDWRDRQALLGLMISRAGSVQRMIALYHALGGGGTASFLRAAILRRVRTPDDLRAVRDAFGLSQQVDWTLIEQMLARVPNENARLRLLRELCVQHPGSFELQLRLLRALERAGRIGEARRLAHRLRADPLADAGVRTALGEMYLRLSEEAEARRVFSEIVEFAPYDAAARRRLGDLYRAHGWFEEAYRQYRTLSEIRPDDRSVDLLLAQAAAGAGRVDEAIRLEQGLAETAEPGAMGGLARVAVLWTSVRLAKMRREAREAGDAEQLRALLARVRRSGSLRGSSALQVALTWSHPDAGLSLWVGHPGSGLTRPVDIAPEFGIEVFELTEQESGQYRLEVRRASGEDLQTVEAELVLIWNVGQADEQILVVPLRFEGETNVLAWTIEARGLSEAEPSARASRETR